MKKIFITIMAAACVFAGCNQNIIETVQEGQFSLKNISATGDYAKVDLTSDGRPSLSTKAETAPDVNDFVIDIVRTSGDVSKHFDRFGDMPQVLNLPSGVYTITASSPQALPAAFDQPVYGASKTFSVNVGKVTSESLVCTLQNIKVLFTLSDAFKSELSSYTISVSNGEAVENTLYWTNVSSVAADSYTTKDISKAGYFSVAPLKIRVDGKRATDGSEAYHEITLLDVTAKTQLEISLDAKVTGNAGFQITCDPYDVNPRPEDVYVPGFDEIPVPDLPEDGGDDNGGENGGENNGSDNGDDNTGGEVEQNNIVLDWPENPTLATTDISDEMNILMYVTAPDGIEDFIVTITSQSQEFMQTCSYMTSNPWSGGELESIVIDLIDDPVAVTSMSGIGLKTGTDLYGKTTPVEFNISTLVPLIPTQGPVYGSDYYFNLKVIDSKGNSNDWDLVFHLPIEMAE